MFKPAPSRAKRITWAILERNINARRPKKVTPRFVANEFNEKVKEVADGVEKRFRVSDKKPLKLPSREELCVLALDVYRLALSRKLSYINKKGEAKDRDDPDFTAATAALKVAGEIAGYSKNGARAGGGESDSLNAEQALQRLRSKAARDLDDEPAEEKKTLAAKASVD